MAKGGQVVLGHGVDLVDIEEFGRLLKVDSSNQNLHRYFTAAELSEAGNGVDRLDKLAGRFATKEAVMKALGVGWGEGISFTDVEVKTLASGAPNIALYRLLAARQELLRIDTWHVSTSHNGGMALASVIAIGSVGSYAKRSQ